ncbi:flagellar hook capping FlgD N-terminal domain-containing protein [Thioclava sp. F36-6]|uniref:flagellar hook capping FlgD N-terminal domain-containing protein n=1 Tax=Thioclava sp. F36-6 TaxID=1915316 RepID=UPI00099660A7|nr:flagellar hook capping FlgD N-terminal domain-containing protein [Thioclava sp. F36-6]OOY32129.1 flagellar basal body rod modification protein [Thioclava sp. F36-6]
MTTTSPITSPATATSAVTAAENGTGTKAPSALSSDFETFLTMLTVQMKNQDPLNPIESADFAVQLATFSGVEQQVKTNDLLTALSGQIGLGGLSELAGWVGMQARAEAPSYFDGATPVDLAPAARSGADAAVLVVTDSTGRQVAQKPISPALDSYAWDGTNDAAQALGAGQYSFALQSYASGSLIGTDPVAAYTRVTEVQSGADGALLTLEGGATIAADTVSALREG